MIELRGAPVAQAIMSDLALQIAALKDRPRLASLVDPQAADAVAYSRQQRRACEKVGIDFAEYELDDQASGLIDRLNGDPEVTSIFLHEPSPNGLRSKVASAKDPENPIPCTAEAVIAMIDFYEISLDGTDVVVVGRSQTVGRPLVSLLLDRRPGPTVTVCHSGTRDLAAHTRQADLLIAAAGRPALITDVRPGCVVIDVGTNVVDEQLVGDVDRDAVAHECAALSPVPGGVGPITVACLLRNVVRSAIEGCARQ